LWAVAITIERPNRDCIGLARVRPASIEANVGRKRKEDLAQLEAVLQDAKPIQFKENIELALKYFDKLTELMQGTWTYRLMFPACE
jgi:hypothetical protein